MSGSKLLFQLTVPDKWRATAGVTLQDWLRRRIMPACGYRMKSPSDDYPYLVIQDALQSIIGGGIAMLLTVTLAGAIPQAAAWSGEVEGRDWLALGGAWFGHWVVAGMMVWGVIASLIPAWCFNELINGRKSPLLVLPLTFGIQLFVSTIAIAIMNEHDAARRAAFASISALGLMLIVIFALIRLCRRNQAPEKPPGEKWSGR